MSAPTAGPTTTRQPSRAAVVAIAVVVATVSQVSLVIALRDTTAGAAGGFPIGVLALLVPGYALSATGVVTWVRRGSRSGPLLIAAGVTWFLATWNSPAAGSAAILTTGLVGGAMCPPVVAHAVLGFPTGRVGRRVERLTIGSAYADAVLLLGLLPTLVFDPAGAGCHQCPGNLLGVADRPALQEQLIRAGLGVGVACMLALVLLAGRQVHRGSRALRRAKLPVAGPGTAFLGLVALEYAHRLARPVTGDDGWGRMIWWAQAAALTALAGGVAWGWVRARRTRADIAGLVVDLAAAPPPGGLRDALAQLVGDPSLRVAYPLRDGQLVDARGEPVADDRPATTLVRGEHVVAVLTHRPGSLDDAESTDEVARAAALVLDHERLQAELAAQLLRLRSSQQRIVAAGDAERRRLERNLHDGAQQRLVTLLLELRLLRSSWGSQADPDRLARAAEVEDELTAAVAELRAVAHGIFPAVLADEGLCAAIEDQARRRKHPGGDR